MYDWLTSDRATTYNDSINKWVFDNEIFSRSEISNFEEQVSNIAHNRSKYENIKVGNEYVVIVENKIVFTDADNDNPYISEIIEVMSDYGKDISSVRETIFTNARWLQSVNGVQGTPNVNIFPEGFLIRYKASGNGIVGKSAGNQKRRSRKSLVRESLKKFHGKTIPSDDVKYLVKLYEEYSTPRQPAYLNNPAKNGASFNKIRHMAKPVFLKYHNVFTWFCILSCKRRCKCCILCKLTMCNICTFILTYMCKSAIIGAEVIL